MTSMPEGTNAINPNVARFVDTSGEVVDFADTDFTDVSAVVLAARDLNNGVVAKLKETGFGLSMFVVADPDQERVELGLVNRSGRRCPRRCRRRAFGPGWRACA
jgi:hypothetical protein